MENNDIIEVNYSNIHDNMMKLNKVIGRMKTLDLNMCVRAKNAQYEKVYGVLYSVGRPEDFTYVLEEDRIYLNAILNYVEKINTSLVKYYEIDQNIKEQVFVIKNILSLIGKTGPLPNAIIGLWNILTGNYGEISGQSKAAKTVISIISKTYQMHIKHKHMAQIIKNNNKVNIAHKIQKYKGKKALLKKVTKLGVFGAIGGRIKSGFGLGVKTFKSNFEALSFSKATNVAERIGVVARMGRGSFRRFY